ncbi:radical SAM protein [Desulforegula conservatrix]|uniref:radical SAM protein n=1 Tax=Desulforegula conservatrix TaxID=153026 RepID=UPI00040A7C36|nr:radical SAM protein [Desulforegula conservatrix]
MESESYTPIYLKTKESGLLAEKIKTASEILKNCILCPRRCGVDRTSGKLGVCKTGRNAFVSSYGPHYGEEEPLVGESGSGAIFFTHCNLGCIFCQNYEVSIEGKGFEMEDDRLAHIMIGLQNEGCHNINLVTPTHVVPQIIRAIDIACDMGLCIPIVYNSSGYDSIETLKLLDGIVDIYMPDFKFWNPESSKMACNAPDYPEVAKIAIKEMHRQTGDLETGDIGLAYKGLLIRHLVMPGMIDQTENILNFIAKEISTKTYVNIMPQYRPFGEAENLPELNRMITGDEYKAALESAVCAGLERLDSAGMRFIAG